MEIQDFLIAAIQNITVLIAQPQNTMSKSNVQIEKIGIYLKGQDDAIRSLLVKAFGIFQTLLDFA
jgi:hypothetical protein